MATLEEDPGGRPHQGQGSELHRAYRYRGLWSHLGGRGLEAEGGTQRPLDFPPPRIGSEQGLPLTESDSCREPRM